MEYHSSTIFSMTTFSNQTSSNNDVFPLRFWELAWLCCIALLGASGSTLVLHVISRSRHTRFASYNLWLKSIAITDLLLFIIAVPNYVLSTSVYDHPSGEKGNLLCKLVTGYSINQWLLLVSTFHFIGISTEVIKLIVNPTTERANVAKLSHYTLTKIKIAVAWILPFLGNLPAFVYNKYSADHPDTGNFCAIEPDWPNVVIYVKVVHVVVYLMYYPVPLFVLVFTTLRIRQQFRHLEKALLSQEAVEIGPNEQEFRRLVLQRQKKRTLLTLSMVAVAFSICWAPCWVSVMLELLQYHFSRISFNGNLFQVGLLLEFLNLFMNCVLYAYLSDEFRRHFCLTFPKTARFLKSFRLKCKCKKGMVKTPLISSYSDTCRESIANYNTI